MAQSLRQMQTEWLASHPDVMRAIGPGSAEQLAEGSPDVVNKAIVAWACEREPEIRKVIAAAAESAADGRDEWTTDEPQNELGRWTEQTAGRAAEALELFFLRSRAELALVARAILTRRAA